MPDKEEAEYKIDIDKEAFQSERRSFKIHQLFKGFLALFAIKAAFTAAKKLVSALVDHDKALNTLNQAVLNQGLSVRQVTKAYQGMARALSSQSTFSDEAIMSAQAMLQPYVGHTEITEDLMAAVLDLATRQKTDLKTAVEQVGEAIQGASNPLARFGIVTDAAASQQERTASILEQLNSQNKGLAAAEAKGFGAVSVMGNRLIDLLQAVGDAAAPAIIFFTEQLRAGVESIQQSREFFTKMEDAVDAVAAGGVLAKELVIGITQVFTQSIAGIFASFGQLIQGKVKESLETYKTTLIENTNAIIARQKAFDEQVTELIDRRDSMRSQRDKTEKDRLLKLQSDRNAQANQEVERQKALMAVRSEQEILQEMTNNQLLVDAEFRSIQRQLDSEKDKTKQVELIQKKKAIADRQMAANKAFYSKQQLKIQQSENDARFSTQKEGWDVLGDMESRLSGIMEISKALSLFSISRNTILSIAATWRWLGGIPFIGPILASIASAAISAYAAERTASVLETSLAEGGVIRHPGPQISPLPRGGIAHTVNVTIEGGVSGTSLEAHMVAELIHREQG